MSFPSDSRWQEAVQHLLAVHRPQQAETLLRQQLVRHPREIYAHVLLAAALYQQARYPEARTAAQDALALDPATSEAHYLLCLICSQLNLVPAMVEAIDEALRLQPWNPKYLGARAQVYLGFNQPAEAQRVAELGLAYDPTHAGCRLQRAEALQQQSKWDDLAVALGQLRQAHPTLPAAYRMLGREALRREQFAQAQLHYQEVLRLAPNDPEALAGASQAIRRQLGIGRVALRLDRYLTFISEGTKRRQLKAWGHFLLILVPLSMLCIPLLLFLGFEAVYWRLHPEVRRLRNRPDHAMPYAQQTLYRYGAPAAVALLILAWTTGLIWLLLWLGLPESSLGPGLTGGLTTIVISIGALLKEAAHRPLPTASPMGRLLLAGLTLAGSILVALHEATWPYGPLLLLLFTTGLLYWQFRRLVQAPR
ncbi:tetratricopeptide repeat protein [Hymenobacter cellulosivorans]|uniref:Tetratricopeptide repeat protein n=1 Tax=Hymenobacter cellulosivorans TaxID=2932249 RepID=A0ABY4FGC5_9BACT|nr:tetratricopeptide repeat protein [Hymenobacter cellulosivorans]UOQ55062.1 tetratricopeptide repeat protein [Hymenobacter cellulosivorans]